MSFAIVTRNRRVCLTLEFLWAAYLGASFVTLYLLNLGLSQTQVFGLQAIITVVMIVTDLPLGYIADRFGVRRVIIAGTVVQVIQSVFFVACTTFWQFAISYVLYGLFLSALSNTTATIMTRSVAAIDDDVVRSQTYSAYEKHRIDIRNLGFLVSAVIGGGLVAMGTIVWPFWVQPIIFGAGVIASLGLTRLPKKVGEQKKRPSLVKVVHTMLNNRPNVRNVILLSTIVQMTGYAGLWLFQPRMLLTGMPVWSFALVYFGRSALTIALRKADFPKRVSATAMWLCLWLCMPIGVLAAAFTTGYGGLIVLVAAHAFLSASYEVMTRTYLNKVLPDDYSTRTTELSVVTTSASLSFVLIGPMAGWVKDTYSLSAAFVMIAAVGLCLGAPVFWAFRRYAR